LCSVATAKGSRALVFGNVVEHGDALSLPFVEVKLQPVAIVAWVDFNTSIAVTPTILLVKYTI
jgi:hypothetical protein